jgi:hypothetical protein
MQWNTPLEVIPVVPLERKYCSGRVVADDFNNAWLEVMPGTRWNGMDGRQRWTVGINYTANIVKTVEDALQREGPSCFTKSDVPASEAGHETSLLSVTVLADVSENMHVLRDLWSGRLSNSFDGSEETTIDNEAEVRLGELRLHARLEKSSTVASRIQAGQSWNQLLCD